MLDRATAVNRRSRRPSREGLQIVGLAAPIALTQLAQVALTTVDIAMMGALGAEALAAGGLAIVLFNQLRTMGVGLITSVSNRVAALSARDGGSSATTIEAIRDVVRASFVVATGAGLVGAIALVGAGQVLGHLGQSPTVVDELQPMLLTLAPGLVPCLWLQALRQYTVGMQRPRAIAGITVASIAVNAALNAMLGYGLWFAPRLGLAGIGLATTIVFALSFLALWAVVRRDPVLAPMVSLRGWRAPPATIRELVRLGVPTAATYGSEAGFFSVVALVMGGLGAPALAAHTIVNQLVYITLQVTVGLSHGVSVLVSRSIALGRMHATGRLRTLGLRHGAVVVTGVGAAYLTAPELVLAPFVDVRDPAYAETVSVAKDLLLVAAILQYADCAQNIGIGLLRGLDDTKSGLRATVVGYWIVGLPAAVVLGHALHLGSTGVWSGLLIGLATTAALLLARFGRALKVCEAVPATG